MPGLLDRQRHGLELRAVFVGLEQDLIELFRDGLRAAARGQFGGEGVDLAQLLLLACDGRERGLHLLRGRLAELAAAPAPLEVMRRTEQPQQYGRALPGARRAAVVVGRDLIEMEFVLRGEFPQQIEVDAFLLRLRPVHELGRRRFVEAHQRLRRLDFLPLARIELDLQTGLGLAHDATGVELATIFEQHITQSESPSNELKRAARPAARRAAPPPRGAANAVRVGTHLS